jgi:hypothetical protein
MFLEPPDPEDEDGMEYYQTVSHPMDLATILARVDARMYSTPAAYLADMALILRCMQQLHGVPAAPPLPQPAAPNSSAVQAAAGDGDAPQAMEAVRGAGEGVAAAGDGGEGVGNAPGGGRDLEGPAAAVAAAAMVVGAGGARVGLLADEIATARSSPVAAARDPQGRKGGNATPSPGAAAAGSGGGGGGAVGGADAADSQQQQQQQQGPAHREISRAQALLDEAAELVRQRVWPELVAKCEAIVAKGGPAPAPPGVVLPEHLLPPLPPPAAAGGGGAGGRGGRGDGEGELGRGTQVPPRVTR